MRRERVSIHPALCLVRSLNTFRHHFPAYLSFPSAVFSLPTVFKLVSTLLASFLLPLLTRGYMSPSRRSFRSVRLLANLQTHERRQAPAREEVRGSA